MAEKLIESMESGGPVVRLEPTAQVGMGVYVLGQVMLPPQFYPARKDEASGEIRPESMGLTVFYGARDMAQFYVPVEIGREIQAGDTVLIGPCTVGRGNRFYLRDR